MKKFVVDVIYSTEIEVPDEVKDIDNYIEQNIWTPMMSHEFSKSYAPWDEGYICPEWEIIDGNYEEIEESK